jgi:N-acyl-D-amino-acid deacylase
MGSVLIKGGKVVDGLGGPGFDGHVLIEGDRIEAVIKEGGDVPAADLVIDASGKAVAPGFIDMHSHLDWVLPLDDNPDLLKCLPEQGVTTVVAGNCGVSPAPMGEDTGRLLQTFASINIERPLDYAWRSMAEYLDNLDEVGPGVNVAELAGHASLRFAGEKTRRGAMTPEALDNCLDLARKSLDQGAVGLSFGLGYDPGMFSPLDELEAFCRVAAEAGKPATVHLKAYSMVSPCYPLTYLKAHNVRALKEMLDIARRTGVRLQLSHFIFVGRRSWSGAPACLKMVEDARAEGLDVMIDALPYTNGNTTINVLIPYWFLALGREGFKSRRARARLRLEMEVGLRLVGFVFKDFQVMDAGVPGWDDINGLRITEVAKKWKTSSFEAMLRLSEKSRAATTMLFHTYSGEPGREGPIESVLSRDYCLFESDAIVKTQGYPNPAAKGTFPKILGDYVRERKLITLEEAIRRMSGASAERFGIKDRGTISPGKAADIAIFDPGAVSDNLPQDPEPAGKPEGIEQVFINGERVVKDGSYVQGSRAGRVLRV